MFGNHKPRITGTNEGIWRRIKLIPFEYKIPDEEVKDQSVIFRDLNRNSLEFLIGLLKVIENTKVKELRNLR